MSDTKPFPIMVKRLNSPTCVRAGSKEWHLKKDEEVSLPRRVALDMLQGDASNWERVTAPAAPKPAEKKVKKGEQPERDRK